MRLKTFSAPTMPEALAEVRAALGDDAIIVSTHESRRGRGVQITAARDESADEQAVEKAVAAMEADSAPDASDAMAQALAFHGVPAPLAQRLCAIARSLDAADDVLALAGALDSQIKFGALPEGPMQPAMLIGPAGGGKTITAVKMAARAVMAGRPVRFISTDSIRAGAFEQLAAFARLLERPLDRAASPGELAALLKDGDPNTQAIIDTPASNPFSGIDINDLRDFIACAGCEPVVVMAAGGDPLDAADAAAVYRDLGARRMHVTRVDATRRLGSIVAAAAGASMTISEISITPFVAKGLSSINPVSLARLLTRDPSTPESLQAYESVAQCQ